MAYIGSPAAPTIATVSDGTVTSAKLADDAVTSAKITDGAVTPTDLSTGHPNWDSSGNVGIGTSPTEKLDVVVDSTTSSRVHTDLGGTSSKYVSWNIDSGETYDDSRSILYFNHSGTVGATLQTSYRTGTGITDGLVIRTHEASPIILQTNNAERMRIDSSGVVLVGATSTGSWSGTNPNIACKSSVAGQQCFTAWNAATSGTRYFGYFGVGSTFSSVGSISSNGSSTAYNTTSDYRLKENVVEVTDGISRVKLLKPSKFNFIVDPDKTVDGFLAHEVADVVPEAITGTKDAMKTEEYEVTPAVEATYDEEGNELTPAVEAVMGTREVPEYQGIDQSKLVPLLTAALQEAIAKIESLEARVATLESA